MFARNQDAGVANKELQAIAADVCPLPYPRAVVPPPPAAGAAVAGTLGSGPAGALLPLAIAPAPSDTTARCTSEDRRCIAASRYPEQQSAEYRGRPVCSVVNRDMLDRKGDLREVWNLPEHGVSAA